MLREDNAELISRDGRLLLRCRAVHELWSAQETVRRVMIDSAARVKDAQEVYGDCVTPVPPRNSSLLIPTSTSLIFQLAEWNLPPRDDLSSSSSSFCAASADRIVPALSQA